jgi:hypothetical protein
VDTFLKKKTESENQEENITPQVWDKTFHASTLVGLIVKPST